MKDARPTSGKVLLALFNIIGNLNPEMNFLDLFAGTGRVGFEAKKRGAGKIVFVESVKSRAEELKKLSKNDFIVLSLDVRRAINWLVKREMKFNFIFADPPYNSGWCKILPGIKNLEKIFSPDCIFIIEHSEREKFVLNTNDSKWLEIFLQKSYGETCLTFLRGREK